MDKYDFIKKGATVYWHDPDGGLSDGEYEIISAPEEIEEDSKDEKIFHFHGLEESILKCPLQKLETGQPFGNTPRLTF